MELSQQILSDLVTFNKYARFIPEINRRETWEEICQRNAAMHIRKYPQLREEIKQVYKDFVIPKKVLPSMRSMQFAGAPIEISNVRIFNCSYNPIDHPFAFAEIIHLLLSGVGVGFSVRKKHVDNLPVIKGPTQKNRRFLISDSIEGWADAVKVLIKAYTAGKSDPVFDFRDIRPKGAMLVTAGGKAPGPDPLRICLDQLRSILNSSIGRKLTPIECYDMCCHISDAVLAGGIRRCCFEESQVVLEDGSTKKLFEVTPGDIIEDGLGGTVKVTAVFDNGIQPVQKVHLEDGTFFECTSNHYWYVYNHDTDQVEWVRADQLTNGNFSMIDRTSADTSHIRIVNVENTQEEKHVYDIEVDSEKHAFKIISPNGAIGISHNSACIAGFDPDDEEMLSCKTGAWWELNPQRGRTNNSVVLHRNTTTKEDFFRIWERVQYSGAGEPGFYWTNSEDGFTNPCVETFLEPHTFCNLTEISANGIDTQEEFNNRAKAGAFLGTLQAGYTDFHYLRSQWKENTERDALIGVGITGIANENFLMLDDDLAARIVVEENERVANLIGINKAARCTVVKPSGTASCVVGTSSGIHAWHHDYYIRRVRVGKNEELYQYLMKTNPDLIEDCVFKPHIEAVVSLPQKAPDGAILRTESALDLLERVKRFNQNWVHRGHRTGDNHHNVSCTISIKDDEWDIVGEWMWENRKYYTGIAVLPYSNHTYKQAPFENITKEQYDDMMPLLHSIDLTQVHEYEDTTNLAGEAACAGGVCEVTQL